MMDDVVFVDVQGFKTTGNIFIPKEICLSHRDFEFHDILKSPCLRKDLTKMYKHQADWYSYHGLKFDLEGITLSELVERTSEHINGKTLVVKGDEKVQWVKQIYENCCIECLNVSDCGSFIFTAATKYEIDSICPHHKSLRAFNKCHCALARAQELKALFLI